MAASISISFRIVFTNKFPNSLRSSKTLIPSFKPTSLFSKPISFQKIPTKTPLHASPSPPPSSSTSLQPIEELPPKLQEIVKLFQSVQEPKAKYEQLLFYGKNLKPLDAKFKTTENKVQGCVSQVWVRGFLDSNKNIVFEADSDSVLTKGLAALLVQGLSGRPVEEVVRVSPDFVVLLGLQQSLTPSRNNGFLNMLKLMQKKALELFMEAERSSGSNGVVGGADSSSGSLNSKEIDDGSVDHSKTKINSLDSEARTDGDGSHGSDDRLSTSLGSRGIRIREKLTSELSPVELDVEDISYQHAGHAGARGSDGETHFNVKVVSNEFEGKSLVKRHRLVYNLLEEELQSGLHALSIVAKTPAEVDTN